MTDADIIVVGAGSAGSAMAGRLSEDPSLRVLVIEAGRSDAHPFTRLPAANVGAVQNPEFDWCMKADPDPSINNRVETWSAAKVLGGGSAINGMMFIRGHQWDYDHWAELGAKGWDYKSVLPFFRRMETNEGGADTWRGDSGPQHVSENRAPYPVTQGWIDAAVQAGIPRSKDLNGEVAEGVDRVQLSQRGGWRWSSAAGSIRANRKRANLQVELKCRVLRVVFEGRRAVGVEIEQNGMIRVVRARAGVVVCCGTVNSARLLQISGIGPASELTALGIKVIQDLPVGRNLQDHVGAHLVDGVDISTLNMEVSGLAGLKHGLRFLLSRRGALTTGIGHAQAFVATSPGLPAPNIQLSFLPLAFGRDDEGKIQLLREPAISTMVALMRPKSRGTVTLRSPDPFAPPRIRHQLLGDPGDLEQLLAGLRIARSIIAQPAMAPYHPREHVPGPAVGNDDAALRRFFRSNAVPMYHPVGTCRIGSDGQGVVSPDLAVHGMTGLWVADCSVMPSLTSGNTNATAIMIGDKGASHVLVAIRSR